MCNDFKLCFSIKVGPFTLVAVNNSKMLLCSNFNKKMSLNIFVFTTNNNTKPFILFSTKITNIANLSNFNKKMLKVSSFACLFNILFTIISFN